jgi:SAM-dependent methyltransferase
MERVPEPELMDDVEQARAYGDADFEAPNALFTALLGREFPDLPAAGSSLDLGCGPGDISFRVATALPGWRIDAVDGSAPMIALACERAQQDPAGERLKFSRALLPDESPPGRSYDLIFSNSLLHHLPDPQILWESIKRYAGPGARVLVMDLIRPGSPGELQALVEKYAAGEPAILRHDFRASLFAAYRPQEVEDQLEDAGLEMLRVDTVSDRHWIASGRFDM